MKVAELEGAELDAAVARCMGRGTHDARYVATMHDLFGKSAPLRDFAPSRLWQDGGPIIERESLALFRQEWSDGSLREWLAGSSHDLDEGPKSRWPTPLIAAMRAYVASKFGDEVEL